MPAVPPQRTRTSSSTRTVSIAAPADTVYRLLADAERWPLLLPDPVHVERIDFDGTRERLRTWDLTPGGHIRSHRLQRTLDPRTRTITHTRQDTTRPGTPTTGTWTVHPDGDSRTRLTLHQQHPTEPHPETGPETGPDAGTDSLLARLTRLAEHHPHLDELLLSFHDTVHLDGPAEVVYDFLHHIRHWPDRTPHIDLADVTEDTPGIQLATLETTGPDGLPTTTRTVRLCFPAATRIVFKELTTPAPIAAHTGEWSLTPHATGTTVTCAQQILLHHPTPTHPHTPATTAELARTRHHLRTRLGRTTTDTLRLATWRARTAVRRLH